MFLCPPRLSTHPTFTSLNVGLWLQEFRKEVTKALPGYYVFFDDTALHVTWAWAWKGTGGYLDDEIPTMNFEKGNHDRCQFFKRFPGMCWLHLGRFHVTFPGCNSGW